MTANLFPQEILSTLANNGTTVPAKIYVNGSTGSDVTGDGSAAHPYATLQRGGRDYFHARVQDNVEILLASGTYAAGDICIDPTFVGEGCLSIVGVGAPARKGTHGGPHTVASVADIGMEAQRVTVAGAAWTVDEFCGYWIRVVTGAHVGKTFVVYGNNAGDLIVPLDSSGDKVAALDTIEVIAPTTVVMADSLQVLYRPVSNVQSVTGASRLNFVNLRLDLSASVKTSAVTLAGTNATLNSIDMDFVRLDIPAFSGAIDRISVNLYGAYNSAFVADAGYGIANGGLGAMGPGACVLSAGGRSDAVMSLVADVCLYNVAFLGNVMISGSGCGIYCAAAALAYYSSGGGGEFQGWLAGVDASTPGIYLAEAAGIFEFKMHVERDCSYALDVGNANVVYFHSDNSCSSLLCSNSAIQIGPLSRVMIHDSCASFLGAKAGQCAYIFSSNSTKSATWPGANTLVTDALGAQLLRTT